MTQPPPPRNPGGDIALVAFFAALIAVCSILPGISLGPAPITLQTFAVLLAGAVLGANRGALAVLLYLVIGAAGLPIFAGGAAGLAPFAGPTVGYLVSFPLAAYLTGFLVECFARRRSAIATAAWIGVAAFTASLLLTHTLGPLGLAWRANMDIGAAFVFDLAFWPGDLIKIVLVVIVGAAVHRAFPALLPVQTRAIKADRLDSSAEPTSDPEPAPPRA